MAAITAVPATTAAHRVSHTVALLLFVNTSGSFFVLLRLSTEVSDATSSGLLAAAVLSAPWLAAVGFVKPLGRLLARRSPGRLIRVAEPGSLALTLAAAALPAHGVVLLTAAASVLLLRGFFEAVTRSATSVLLRITVPDQRLTRANTLAEISKLAGTGAGAALAGLADPTLSVRGCLALNAATLAVSALLGWTLPPAGQHLGRADMTTAGSRLRLDNPVLRNIFALFLLVAFWQGFHTVAVNVVPREVLGGDTALVGAFVTVSAVAIFAGSFAALPIQSFLTRLPLATWALVPMPWLLAAVLVGRPMPALGLYGIFMMFFEVAYVYYNNRLLATARPDEVATVVTLRATVLPLGVIASTLGVGVVSDVAGPFVATAAVVAVTVVVVAATARRARALLFARG